MNNKVHQFSFSTFSDEQREEKKIIINSKKFVRITRIVCLAEITARLDVALVSTKSRKLCLLMIHFKQLLPLIDMFRWITYSVCTGVN